MKIAVTSQNVRNVTAHAGRCRKFWIYEFPEFGTEIDKKLVEVDINNTLHAMRASLPEALSEIDTLITAGIGESLKGKLLHAGVSTHISNQSLPDVAALEYMAIISKLKHSN